MDTETSITNAQSPEAFDVLAFIEGAAYPVEKVVIFQNVAAADQYVKLVAKRTEYEAKEKEPTTEYDEEINRLAEDIRRSSIVFELRGMPPGIVNDILHPVKDEEEVTPEQSAERDNSLIAHTIIRVSNSAGVEDTRVWTGEDVARLRRGIKEGEFAKLLKGVADVNFKAAIFDDATDAGFLGGSADVA